MLQKEQNIVCAHKDSYLFKKRVLLKVFLF